MNDIRLDPRQIDIVTQQMTVSDLAERMQRGQIELAPETEHGKNRWDATRQSRLIESLIVGIPIPSLYFDLTDYDRWLVIDGAKRIRSIERFVVTGELALTGLEYLCQMEGKRHEELPAPIKRRLRWTTIAAHLVKGDTPPAIRDNITARIANTQGITT